MLTAWPSSVSPSSRYCFGHRPCGVSKAKRSMTHQLGGNGCTMKASSVQKDLGQ